MSRGKLYSIGVFWLVIIISISTTRGQYGNCDFFQQITQGQSYPIFSPGYGSNQLYTPGISCRWRALAPVGASININCVDLRFPQNNCLDRLDISWSGRLDLSDAQQYCFNQPFSYSTSSNQITMALRSSPYYSGGMFLCTLTVLGKPQPILQPQPTPQQQQQSPQQQQSYNPCDCGRRKTSKIVGGSFTGVNEFTMMAGLVTDNSVFCGATILSPNYALTSAHCLIGRSPNDVVLLVGDHDYRSLTDTPYAQQYRIAQFRIHNFYDPNTIANDIATVQTIQSITFNVAVGPVCLPPSNNVFTNQNVEGVGWGSTSFGGPVSTVLKKVNLNVIANQQCSVYYQNVAVQITNNQICTLTLNQDTCQKDSGGPLISTIYGRAYIAGIVSYGQGCATVNPAVSTRVTMYLDWIKQNTPGAVYC